MIEKYWLYCVISINKIKIKDDLDDLKITGFILTPSMPL